MGLFIGRFFYFVGREGLYKVRKFPLVRWFDLSFVFRTYAPHKYNSKA